MDERKKEFLRKFGNDYGYPDSPKNIDEIRTSEFKRLDGIVYLDHAGATLYSEVQMEAVVRDLNSSVYGNPHSQSDSSSTSSNIINAARQQVLDYCNASPKDYKCIFTSGATGALKLVGEAFPWSSESCFMYTRENHNSVLGIREYALNKGSAAIAVDVVEYEHHSECSPSFKLLTFPIQRRNAGPLVGKESNDVSLGTSYNLFAFPSECNFSGKKFDLNLVKIFKEDRGRCLEGIQAWGKGCWMVLIDAAKGCSMEPPDLTKFPADFVIVSFYKIFGYPTGLGALVVRTEAAEVLRKTYFSGGTVSSSIADIDFVRRRTGVEESFEDGTLSFLGIASISHGFKIINTLRISSISRHITSLASYVRNMLKSLKHENGASVCKIYGDNDRGSSPGHMGSIIAFNLKRSDGSWVGYREVEKLASLSGIQLRTGCFCNPGACSTYLSLSHSDLLYNIEAGHICWDDHDILRGKPTGAVRISFGYMSTFEDADKFVQFIVSTFTKAPIKEIEKCQLGTTTASERNEFVDELHLKSILIYPIKSCAGFSVHSWPLCSNGLLHDREWLLKGLSGEILTQKKVPEMCLIRTSIDLCSRILTVESPRCIENLKIPLDQISSMCEREKIELNGQRYEIQGYDDEINTWFTNAISRSCSLVRCVQYHNQSCQNGNSGCRDVQSPLNFVNEAQFLLISEQSVSDLNNRLSERPRYSVNPLQFRPNLVISGGEPYDEDNWKRIVIGKQHFTTLGGCNRCQMINIDQQSGQIQKSKQPLATLASYRRAQGKILFGILLRYEHTKEIEESRLEVGQRIYPDKL